MKNIDSDFDDPFCRLYLDSQLDHRQLIVEFAEIVGGEITANLVCSGELDMTIDRNDGFDKERMQLPDGWLHFPYTVEIDPTDDTASGQYIEALTHLINSCRARRIVVVAVCDFEDRIPKNA